FTSCEEYPVVLRGSSFPFRKKRRPGGDCPLAVYLRWFPLRAAIIAVWFFCIETYEDTFCNRPHRRLAHRHDVIRTGSQTADSSRDSRQFGRQEHRSQRRRRRAEFRENPAPSRQDDREPGPASVGLRAIQKTAGDITRGSSAAG